MFDLVLRWDAALGYWFVTHRLVLFDWLMLGLSAIGRAGAVWLVLAAVLAARRIVKPRASLHIALALGLAGLVTDGALKPLVARARPWQASSHIVVIGPQPTTSSFPSGHAATSFAGALLVARAWPPARVAVWTLAMLIAFSRVYLGVHYPLDVLGGAFIGVACAALVTAGGRGRDGTKSAFQD